MMKTMSKTIVLGFVVVALLAAVLLAGCAKGGAAGEAGGANASGGAAGASDLKAADIPDYNDSIDSEIDNLSAQLS
ncbi:Uncharacterised protein [Candidatus Gugararchaeum adminiculabundum]|nr:Uncharacterised protein [Candidatus Gugararchaeum adminiculabundum]